MAVDPGSFVLRFARPDEAVVLADLHARSWQVTYGPLLAEADRARLTVEERLTLWDRVLGDPRPRETVWVAAGQGRVIGLVLVGPSHDADATPDVGEVQAIHVDPELRSRGVGARLLAAAVESLAADGFAGATLWVIRQNVRARHFYERHDWRADGGTKRGPMGDFPDLPTVDEVRYARPLPAPPDGRA